MALSMIKMEIYNFLPTRKDSLVSQGLHGAYYDYNYRVTLIYVCKKAKNLGIFRTQNFYFPLNIQKQKI